MGKCEDKDNVAMMTTMRTTARTSTTKQRDGNLLPHGDAAQRNGGGLPQTSTNDGDGGASNDDDT